MNCICRLDTGIKSTQQPFTGGNPPSKNKSTRRVDNLPDIGGNALRPLTGRLINGRAIPQPLPAKRLICLRFVSGLASCSDLFSLAQQWRVGLASCTLRSCRHCAVPPVFARIFYR